MDRQDAAALVQAAKMYTFHGSGKKYSGRKEITLLARLLVLPFWPSPNYWLLFFPLQFFGKANDFLIKRL